MTRVVNMTTTWGQCWTQTCCIIDQGLAVIGSPWHFRHPGWGLGYFLMFVALFRACFRPDSVNTRDQVSEAPHLEPKWAFKRTAETKVHRATQITVLIMWRWKKKKEKKKAVLCRCNRALCATQSWQPRAMLYLKQLLSKSTSAKQIWVIIFLLK